MLRNSAQAFFIVMLSINLSITDHGGGKHQWNISMDQVVYARRVGRFLGPDTHTLNA